MNYCSNCGSDQIHWTIPSGDNRSRWVCSSCATIHYSNPKIITGCLPVWNDQVLLCRRAIEPRRGFWNIPGGFMENGETVEEGAQREVWEEALGKVDIIGVLTIFNLHKINQVYIHFLGELREGRFGVGVESLESQLFREEEIPWSEMAFESSIFTLRSYFADKKAGIRQVHLSKYPL